MSAGILSQKINLWGKKIRHEILVIIRGRSSFRTGGHLPLHNANTLHLALRINYTDSYFGEKNFSEQNTHCMNDHGQPFFFLHIVTPNNILVWTGAYRSKCLYKELFNNVAGTIEALTFSLAQWSLVGENFLRSPPSFQVFTCDLDTAHGQLMMTMRVMKSFVLNKEQIFLLLDQPSQSTVLTSNSNITLAQSILQTGLRPIYYQHCIVRIPDDWNTEETQRSKLPYLSVAWCLSVLYTKLKHMVDLSTNSVGPISPEKRIDTCWTPISSARWTICNKDQTSEKITCLFELEFLGHPVIKSSIHQQEFSSDNWTLWRNLE